MNETPSHQVPSHQVFVVEDRAGTDSEVFWTKVGAAWPHKDGRGLNIVLTTGLAVSGRLVLREYNKDEPRKERNAGGRQQA